MVGALLGPPHKKSSLAGVIFFNNVGYLGMCGHGTIGVVTTLAHVGRIRPGDHQIDTPAGTVQTRLHSDGSVTFTNVQSYRWKTDVGVEVPGKQRVIGDIAYGGNWFFLTHPHGHKLSLSNAESLARFAQAIRQGLERDGVTGEGGAAIDHIGLFGPSPHPRLNSRNFVLCPGGMYDRSPCGTGTSAKLATLYTAGKLREGKIWRQESIVGSVFEGHITVKQGAILPSIRGRAYLTGDCELLLDPSDPFRHGILV